MIVLVLLADGSSTSGDEEDEDNKGYGNIIPGSWPEYGDEDKGGSGAVKLAAKAKAAVKAAADGDKKARPAVFTKEGRLFEDFFENQRKIRGRGDTAAAAGGGPAGPGGGAQRRAQPGAGRGRGDSAAADGGGPVGPGGGAQRGAQPGAGRRHPELHRAPQTAPAVSDEDADEIDTDFIQSASRITAEKWERHGAAKRNTDAVDYAVKKRRSDGRDENIKLLRTLHLSNIHPETTEEEIFKYFNVPSHGEVEEVEIITTDSRQKTALLVYARYEEADHVLNLPFEEILNGRVVEVSKPLPDSDSNAGPSQPAAGEVRRDGPRDGGGGGRAGGSRHHGPGPQRAALPLPHHLHPAHADHQGGQGDGRGLPGRLGGAAGPGQQAAAAGEVRRDGRDGAALHTRPHHPHTRRRGSSRPHAGGHAEDPESDRDDVGRARGEDCADPTAAAERGRGGRPPGAREDHGGARPRTSVPVQPAAVSEAGRQGTPPWAGLSLKQHYHQRCKCQSYSRRVLSSLRILTIRHLFQWGFFSSS